MSYEVCRWLPASRRSNFLIVLGGMTPHTQMITLSSILATASSFSERLDATKARISDVRWYPYHSMTNVPVIARITQDLEIAANTVLDIGAADGDLSLLF